MLDRPYPIEFIDEGDRIVSCEFEEWNGRRTIHMTDADPDEGIGTISAIRSDVGTKRFWSSRRPASSYPYYNDAGVPLTRNSVVTERYSISADGRRMDWTATTVDPTVFSRLISRLGGLGAGDRDSTL